MTTLCLAGLMLDTSLWGKISKHTSEMNFKNVFVIALALSLIVTVGMILYSKGTVQDMIEFGENTHFYSSTQFFAYQWKLLNILGSSLKILEDTTKPLFLFWTHPLVSKVQNQSGTY